MEQFKKYLYSLLIGNKYHFKCDCTFKMDIIGIVKDINIKHYSDVIIYIELENKKIIKITANHPNLMIEPIKKDP